VSEIIDISVPTGDATAIWPGSPGFEISRHLEIKTGDDANASAIQMDVHAGTHVDAPLHFVEGGKDVEDIGLSPFIGSAVVVDISQRGAIEASELESLGVPLATERLLMRTNGNSEWFAAPFDPDATALAASAARWVVERGMKLVGIDGLSIQRFADGPETHQILLGGGVCVLEGLDLRDASPGTYDLVCLPLRLQNAEAAPARAILRSID
jgi:arylformamidase